MKKNVLFIILVVFTKSSIAKSKYNYTIYDSPNRSTMYAYNQNYLSTYRIFSREINMITPKYSPLIQVGLIGLFGLPLTHEEGHRSVLTNLNIGAVSMSFFNSYGAAYVKGVTDETLKDLRDNSFADYIHLHTAGLESDYQLSGGMEDLMAFEEEEYKILWLEYIFRKISLVSYMGLSASQGITPEMSEESNEFDRDIVGHDVWGMIRHLHRPDMEFKRYTNYDDLSGEEKEFASRVAWRSLANLVSPMIFGYRNFNISEGFKLNASLGYTISPFGDYFDQNLWVFISDKYKFKLYFREYENKVAWFPAGGFGLLNYKITDKLYALANIDLWQQPEDLSFTTDVAQFGWGSNIEFSYLFYSNSEAIIKGTPVNFGGYFKSKGYLPEFAGLDESYGMRIGFGFSY